MLADLQLAVRLQELDNRVTELTREISALPKHIAEIEKKLESHTRKLEADRAALTANQKDRKKDEGDVQLQEQKISKLRAQMLDAKTNEQYRAFQHEIEFCEKEIRRAEDHVLELMAESEPLDRNVKAAELALKAEKAQVDAEKQEAVARTAEDKKALEQAQQERAQIVARLNPSLYRQYERIRKGRRGVAIAEAVDGRCGACQIALRLQFYQDLKRGDQVMFCESCARIIYYNPPVAFEDVTGESASAVQG
ncbi:MAG TPA: C4-type zinc ribbon domain-containing protein [Bryobacteraceae bacterium]|nr:C4-type zinc ribbon domain-containing protein [Bryobacteraceae bacterium]